MPKKSKTCSLTIVLKTNKKSKKKRVCLHKRRKITKSYCRHLILSHSSNLVPFSHSIFLSLEPNNRLGGLKKKLTNTNRIAPVTRTLVLLLSLINVDGLQLGLKLRRYRRGDFVRFPGYQPLEAAGQLSLQSLEAGLLVVY